MTICLLAVLAIAAEARHVKKTRNRGNAKMLSLIEKMNKQRFPDSFPAQVEHYIYLGKCDNLDFFFRLNIIVRLNTSAALILITMDIMTASAAQTPP